MIRTDDQPAAFAAAIALTINSLLGSFSVLRFDVGCVVISVYHSLSVLGLWVRWVLL